MPHSALSTSAKTSLQQQNPLHVVGGGSHGQVGGGSPTLQLGLSSSQNNCTQDLSLQCAYQNGTPGLRQQITPSTCMPDMLGMTQSLLKSNPLHIPAASSVALQSFLGGKIALSGGAFSPASVQPATGMVQVEQKRGLPPQNREGLFPTTVGSVGFFSQQTGLYQNPNERAQAQAQAMYLTQHKVAAVTASVWHGGGVHVSDLEPTPLGLEACLGEQNLVASTETNSDLHQFQQIFGESGGQNDPSGNNAFVSS